MHSESDRAAKLVDFVLNKVELAPEYYSVFTEALEVDKVTNIQVLKLLKETLLAIHILITGYCM